MNPTNTNSDSSKITACSDERTCKRCKKDFSIQSLTDGCCFTCSVELFKKSELKKLGFDYIMQVLAGEVNTA